MKVLIIGLPYFAKKLASDLRAFDPENTYTGFDVYYSKKDLIKYLLNLLTADIVYSINGTLENSGTLAVAKFFKKKIMMQWVGTDVLKSLKNHKKGVRSTVVDYATHYTEVPWIKEELQEINIQAEILLFTVIENFIVKKPIEKISILSYIGEGREQFYGINCLITLANRFPHLTINIVGIDKYSCSLPKNIKLLGWVNNMGQEYKKHAVFLRLAEHDGLPNTILEALAHQLYVGFTFEFPHTQLVKTDKQLFDFINNLYKQVQDKMLPPNQAGSKFVKSTYNNDIILTNLIKQFKSLVH